MIRKRAQIINMDAYRSKRDVLSRMSDDDVLDVALAAHWHNSEAEDMAEQIELRKRMRRALIEVREYLQENGGRVA